MASHACRWLIVVLLASAACAVACNEAAVPAGEESEAAVDPAVSATLERDAALEPGAAPALEAEQIEQLGAIGYSSGTERAGAATGVVRNDPERVEPGLNFLTSGHGPVALLMDMKGEVLHEWRAEFEQVFPEHRKRDRAKEPHRNFWRDAVLFPNGDILVVWELFGLFKLDRNSRVLWAVAEPVHHDLLVTEAGEIVHLQSKRKMIAGIPEKKAIEDYIVVRDEAGRELRRLALVSMAMLDTIAILDMETGTTRWWQQGPFGMQHQPQPTPDGGIILFNNFLTDERSSVATLDPETRQVIREYTGPETDPLYSRRSGRVRVLRNGNILIVETDGGRALEVTPADELVWQYQSPYLAGKNSDRVANLYSLDRVGAIRTRWLGE